MTEALSKELADPALGNDTNRARELLCAGADIGYDFNAAVQNAAAGGHGDVLKLMLVADPEFLIAKQDAFRAAGRKEQFGINDLLLEAATDEGAYRTHKNMRAGFVAAVKEQRTADASQLLDRMVAVMFPKPPKAV